MKPLLTKAAQLNAVPLTTQAFFSTRAPLPPAQQAETSHPEATNPKPTALTPAPAAAAEPEWKMKVSLSLLLGRHGVQADDGGRRGCQLFTGLIRWGGGDFDCHGDWQVPVDFLREKGVV